MSVGRNQPCPCGSGKKYKQCCGRTEGATAARAAVASPLDQATQLLQSGQHAQAEHIYLELLARNPRNAQAKHFLGMCQMQTGRREEGLAALRHSVELDPANDMLWLNLGIVCIQVDMPAEAEGALRKAIALRPGSPHAHNYLGVALLRLGRQDEAMPCFERAIALNPRDDATHNNLGYALLERGEAARAATHFRSAIAANPRNAMAHNNLGNALRAVGDAEASLASYRDALQIDPGFAMARFNIGRALIDTGRDVEALAHLRAAARAAPQEPVVWQWLAELLGSCRFEASDGEVERELCQLLARSDIDPSGLACAAASLLGADPAFRALLARAGSAADASIDLAEATLAPLARPLCLLLLEHAIVPEPAWQDLVAALRRAAMAEWESGALADDERCRAVLTALAHQCFLTEYIQPVGAGEARAVAGLVAQVETALAAGVAVDECAVALLACYQPLGQVRGVDSLAASQATRLGRLVLQQVTEPRAEARLASALTTLTPIQDEVSRSVQAQYERNPYPRWTRAPSTGGGFPLALRLRTLFPHARSTGGVPDAPSILIAGCGTGRHVAITAALNPSSSILAVDLSLASLGYAARRAAELELRNVEFARADILELGGMARRFDVIESAGVLHHMRDPIAGWKVLVGLLNPGGWMKIGLYSEIGRRSVVAARELIAAAGYAADEAGMRAGRAAILATVADHPAHPVAQYQDFYSFSGCRDLLFHVQEHRFDLIKVQAMLDELGLVFLGFEFETARTTNAYRKAYPEDAAATSLENWAAFEVAHPDTFAGMYQFWVRRA